jgi:allophanate hydrolase
LTETIAEILALHRAAKRTPAETVAQAYARIRAYDDPALFITLRDEAEACAEAAALDPSLAASLPLFGVPVAVKDNIDVAGLPTTAACPAFAYTPSADAGAGARLRAAGAIVVGKTNLDQFATGLVGVRSPYGTPRNALNAELVPGGSSSGSAVAVGAGLVPLSLGTDTAGSGRVPAMLNNIVGLKPSLGLVSTAGVLPACRTLDCVSIFTMTVDDATAALAVIEGFDPADAYSRKREALQTIDAGAPRLGVPREGQLKFFGDRAAEAAYRDALKRWDKLGASFVTFDLEPFYETARLLYEGPWVAERYLVIRDLLATNPDAVHPVTRRITEAGATISAADTFAALYRLQALRSIAEETLTRFDAMVLPTAPSVYRVSDVLADPIELNSRNGTYTNFVNLLDLCGLAIPAAMRVDGLPFGITLLAPGGRDRDLAALGRRFHADTHLPMGATGRALPPLEEKTPPKRDDVQLAVVGAHLSGMALNGELQALGATLVKATATTPDYKLFALDGTVPPKPGLLRVADGAGQAIAIEIWALTAEAFGRFVAAIPPPLGIGTLRTQDGDDVKGFLVEAAAIVAARDISHFGGWRAFMAEMKKAG